jgi:hypothetical protein
LAGEIYQLAEWIKKIKQTKEKFIFLGDSRGPDEEHFLGEAYFFYTAMILSIEAERSLVMSRDGD